MQSFNTCPDFSKQKAEDLSNTGFLFTGKHFKDKILFITRKNIS